MSDAIYSRPVLVCSCCSLTVRLIRSCIWWWKTYCFTDKSLNVLASLCLRLYSFPCITWKQLLASFRGVDPRRRDSDRPPNKKHCAL